MSALPRTAMNGDTATVAASVSAEDTATASAPGPSSDAMAVISRIRRNAAAVPPPPRPGERCELCSEPVQDRHGHLVDLQARSLMCACRGCYLLFLSGGAGGGHFKAVPERIRSFPELTFSPAQWDALQIPVNVAFFFVNSEMGRVCAFYPGPAGATESLLSLDVWAEVVEANPSLADLEADVEAFLVRADTRQASAPECYLVPIDWCYELVGELRQTWSGFDGGQEAREALDGFFDRVQKAAR